jgi:hypothetical protein
MEIISIVVKVDALLHVSRIGEINFTRPKQRDCRYSHEAIESHFGATLSPLKHSCAGQSRTPEPEWKIDVSLNYSAQTIRRTGRNFLSPHGASPISVPPRLRNFKLLRGRPENHPEGAPPMRSYEFATRTRSVGEYVFATFNGRGNGKVCVEGRGW